MSFNNTFNTGKGGFMLPSFTNVQPTVSVSGVSTSTANGEGNDNGKSQDNSKDNSKDKFEPFSSTKDNTADDLVVNEDEHTDDLDDRKYKPEELTENSLHKNDVNKESTASVLEKMLSSRSQQKPSKMAIKSVESDGKGLFLNDESGDDDDDDFSFDDEKEGLKIEENTEEVEKLNDEFNSILLSKEPPVQSKAEDLSERGEEVRQPSDDADDSELDPEDRQVVPASEELHFSSEYHLSSEETFNPVEPSKQESNSNLIKDNDDLQLLRRKISRTNSIKDIPNPPLNLKKQQAFDFPTFLAQFKSKDCEPVHKYLKSFLNQFNQRIWTTEQQVSILSEFQSFLYEKLIQFKPFNEIGNDETKINNCKEGLEKLVMTRIYASVYSPYMSFIKLTETNKHDKIMDRKFLINTYLYDWIELKHLDLDINLDKQFVDLATKELIKIDDYKSPRDKIVCILNSSKLIFGLIRKQENNEENADSFVPLLIYILIQAKVKFLYSNLQYIERFRNREFLVGETSYYVSTMQIACNFIIDLNKEQLTVETEEYNQKMHESRTRFREQQYALLEDDSPSRVLTKSAEMVKQSLSNSINSFIQNMTHTEEDEAANMQSEIRRNAELSREEYNKIKQISIEENNIAEMQRNKRSGYLEDLRNMFPNLDNGIIEDVLDSTLNETTHDYSVTECVNQLLSLVE